MQIYRGLKVRVCNIVTKR